MAPFGNVRPKHDRAGAQSPTLGRLETRSPAAQRETVAPMGSERCPHHQPTTSGEVLGLGLCLRVNRAGPKARYTHPRPCASTFELQCGGRIITRYLPLRLNMLLCMPICQPWFTKRPGGIAAHWPLLIFVRHGRVALAAAILGARHDLLHCIGRWMSTEIDYTRTRNGNGLHLHQK